MAGPGPIVSRKRPAFLTALAVLGLLLGGIGSAVSFASALPLLGDHDAYIAAARQTAERQVPRLDTDAPQETLLEIVGKQAEVIYARRNAQLPLLALDFIVSTLLLAGCARALQLTVWGWSAWLLAAAASIPYQLLDLMLVLTELRDLTAQLPDPNTPPGQVAQAWISIQGLGALLKTGMLLLYCVVCLIYLRRPSVRARFASGAAAAR